MKERRMNVPGYHELTVGERMGQPPKPIGLGMVPEEMTYMLSGKADILDI
jgi:hypothetical protein